MTILWDPAGGLQTEDGDVLSPATILEHEFDHALAQSEDYTGFRERQASKSSEIITIEQ